MKTEQIQIYEFTVFSGRNIYSHRPVIKMVVNIGKYGEIPTNEIPGFNKKLLELFPGLKTNCCSLGYEGGFVQRLREGTYMAHVLEHVILEMQYMLGYQVSFGKTRAVSENDVYSLAYEYQNEVCGQECGKAAVFILNQLLAGEEVAIEQFFDYLKKISLEAELGPSTSAIVDEAKRRGIPITRIGNESLVRLGYGKHSRLIESTLTDATSCISADISCNKQLTKFLLNENKIPVPFGKIVYSEISALMVADQIGTPVVIKPFDGNQGKGVHLCLKNEKEIKEAFRDAAKYSKGIIVEKYVSGRDFRILVVGGKVRAVSERLPASVTGDGVHTVRELVGITNQDPDRGEQHEKPLTKICLDSVAESILAKNGISAEFIPEQGQEVILRENANLSTGGTAVDCTDIIHPENIEIAEKAAATIGLDIAGIDVVSENISESILDTGGAVVEVNTAPGIRMHLYPSKGTPRSVDRDIVNMLFPDENSMRFPIVSVTGTNGKTTVVRLIQHILSLTGKTVGMTSTSGTFVRNKCVCRGDNSGPRSARSLLSNKAVEAAVLETARGGIVREGLGYDLADVGVITNITEDHLGIDGVDTLEDLAFIKSLVVEAVKKEGAAVLNAEDAMTPYILNRVKVRTVLFSKDTDAIKPYYALGRIFVFQHKGKIQIQDGPVLQDVVPVEEIPITVHGMIECNIENALAATSALYALGVPIDIIRAGLKSFTDNTGRFNLFALHGIRVLLDYGHNPAGYEKAIQVCKKLGGNALAGVIGVPGDRMDRAVKAVGKQCAQAFDRLYIKEDRDLRGRKSGEIAGILYHTVMEENFPKGAVKLIEDELEALKSAIEDAKEDDLIVAFYEKFEPLKDYLESVGAVAVDPMEIEQAVRQKVQASGR